MVGRQTNSRSGSCISLRRVVAYADGMFWPFWIRTYFFEGIAILARHID